MNEWWVVRQNEAFMLEKNSNDDTRIIEQGTYKQVASCTSYERGIEVFEKMSKKVIDDVESIILEQPVRD